MYLINPIKGTNMKIKSLTTAVLFILFSLALLIDVVVINVTDKQLVTMKKDFHSSITAIENKVRTLEQENNKMYFMWLENNNNPANCK